MKPARGAEGTDLDFGLSRRALFPALLREVRVLSGTLKGGRSFALSELAELPGEQLARLIPLVRPAFDIRVEGEQVVAKHKETAAVVVVGPATKETVATLNLFIGQITLETAGRRLAQQMGWEEARGFDYVRELFLFLVGRLVCAPLNFLPSEE